MCAYRRCAYRDATQEVDWDSWYESGRKEHEDVAYEDDDAGDGKGVDSPLFSSVISSRNFVTV